MIVCIFGDIWLSLEQMKTGLDCVQTTLSAGWMYSAAKAASTEFGSIDGKILKTLIVSAIQMQDTAPPAAPLAGTINLDDADL